MLTSSQLLSTICSDKLRAVAGRARSSVPDPSPVDPATSRESIACPASPFVLAASAEMLFVDRPVADRVRAIHDAGFAVEIWDWRNHDLDELEALAASGVVFTSMTGYTTGTLADEAGADELLRTAAESVVVSRRLGTPSLNLHGTGLDDRGLPVVPADEVTPRDVGHRPAHARTHRRAR